jgi:DNA-binding GntR family transcriptional regulator
MNIEVVALETVWERVAGAMRRAIVLGQLAAGSRLNDVALAQHFGVSRLPIREAIAQLEREGLVKIQPRRGVFVVGVTEQDISDTYECRTVIEVQALRRTGAHTGDQEIAALNAIIDQMVSAARSGQPRLVAMSDIAFHRKLLILSGSRALRSCWELLAPLIETILGITDLAWSDPAGNAEKHRKITSALERHDIDAAEHALCEQMKGGEALMRQAMRQRTT